MLDTVLVYIYVYVCVCVCVCVCVRAPNNETCGSKHKVFYIKTNMFIMKTVLWAAALFLGI